MILPLKTRLIYLAIVPIIITGLVASFIGAWMIGHMLSDQAQDKARLDLNSARLIYFHSLKGIEQQLRPIALCGMIPNLLNNHPPALYLKQLEDLRQREGLDILDVVTLKGNMLIHGRADAAPSSFNETIAYAPLVRVVLSVKDTESGTVIFEAKALELAGKGLAQQASIPILQTGQTVVADRTIERAGMMLIAAARITGEDGKPFGVLIGGKLLNRDNKIVDDIRETIYQGEQYGGHDIGVSTIFLGDVRIATTVKLPDGHRAIGTRADQIVRHIVMDMGLPYVAPARVIHERYITAYEPIRDYQGRIVGILSLGIPERKFAEMQKQAMLVFLGIISCGVIFSIFVSGWISRRFSRPIRNLVTAVHDIAGGHLDRRVEPNSGIKEFVILSEGFNKMAASLHDRDLQLKHRTQETISKSERLAMIGRLAAGVAHEINNPLGGIMLFANLLLKKATPQTTEYENLERICNETKRCQKIVQGLLDFARHREPKTEIIDIHNVLDKTLALVENQAMFLNIERIKTYHALGTLIRVDPLQLQQVFINLIMNAVEAMGGRGKIVLATQVTLDGLEIRISDSGPGITEEHMDRLFEPFFTTKEVGHGTGLGLSISRSIIENHGGTMWVKSKLGEGANFFICLPIVKEA